MREVNRKKALPEALKTKQHLEGIRRALDADRLDKVDDYLSDAHGSVSRCIEALETQELDDTFGEAGDK